MLFFNPKEVVSTSVYIYTNIKLQRKIFFLNVYLYNDISFKSNVTHPFNSDALDI